MKLILDLFRTAIKNARRSPQTTTAGITGLVTGIMLLKSGDMSPQNIGAAVTAILFSIGGLLADDPKTNDETTTNNKDS